ncbi:hypothetical protein [Flavobacterium poyangense]|uniref:hypothetical protein n=1 Tax=Flavobacterium poyangense TaxID=2204302 RepID=UPI001421EDCB|nr:hypothetical protein [Flavobacterium sp. JXAS1]
MRFLKLPFIFPFLILSTITSCSSDTDSPSTPDPVLPEVVNPANEKLVSVVYPFSSNIPYMMDKQDFEYDNLKRISKIALGGFVHGITYVNPDLIEINLLDDPIEGIKMQSKKTITLKDGNVVLIVDRKFDVYAAANEVRNSQTDSTLFSYTNKYLSKVQFYRKSVNWGNSYSLNKQVDFQQVNGNITQAKITEVKSGIGTVVNYTHDASPYMNMGDMVYETPLYYGSVEGLHIFFKDKLGKNNVNNITKAELSYEKSLPGYFAYKTINFSRNVDKHGRLTEILLSGTTIKDINETPAGNFINEKMSFIYK